ncbi:uncharacterized protein LOC127752100 [Frankliniella occidentalis]|uniref:Uncharacterized protein LOC127752100 n=1 Tax=Frankliniella occidentalis TaxID=133901 RepID=A0A9C6XVN8_FRAOC|nr:uncharacterized protein LOC127752100 [Frankliniella occidentalis]
MLDEKLEMPSSLAPPLTASWPAGVTKSLTAPGSTASDEGCSPRCSPRCSPTSSPSPSPTSEEEAWRWPEKQDKADSRERCCSSDSAIALPEQDNDSEDDGAQAWPVHGVCSRKCSVDDAADDVDDDIPAGSDASCQGDKRPAAAKAVADDGAFDDTWRSTNNLNQLCLAGLKGLSLDDVRWSRFTEHQGAGVDEDAEVEALVADGCDERGRRVKVFSFDSYDSGVSVSALRRASTQSTGALEDDSHPPYRYWRTPSVVVSDYSDDLSSFAGNAVTLDEIEQFRSQYAARVAAGMETGDLSSTDVSRASSCSNLQQLDADYALRCTGSRKSSYCSTCSTLSGDEDGVVCDSQLEAVRPKTKVSSRDVNESV